MSNALTDTKAQLAADLRTLLAQHAPDETVQVLGYEPNSLPNEQVTVTVTPGDMRPDYITLTVRVYSPAADPENGQGRQETVVAAIADELAEQWMDPQWQFGWDDRLQILAAEATIATPRGLV